MSLVDAAFDDALPILRVAKRQTIHEKPVALMRLKERDRVADKPVQGVKSFLDAELVEFGGAWEDSANEEVAGFFERVLPRLAISLEL